jgi:hypothetical protein
MAAHSPFKSSYRGISFFLFKHFYIQHICSRQEDSDVKHPSLLCLMQSNCNAGEGTQYSYKLVFMLRSGWKAAWAVHVAILAFGTTVCCARVLHGSSSCSQQIFDCEAGRCLLATAGGKSQMVCERCKPRFVPSKDNLQCSKYDESTLLLLSSLVHVSVHGPTWGS